MDMNIGINLGETAKHFVELGVMRLQRREGVSQGYRGADLDGIGSGPDLPQLGDIAEVNNRR